MATNTLKSLSEIFNSERLFRVPDYQRGYSWDEPQLKDFFTDLQSVPEGRYHYTGMLTIERISKRTLDLSEAWKNDQWLWKDRGYRAYYIVDGQQRLTTIAIFIHCLLKHFGRSQIGGLSVDKVREIYLYEMNGVYPSFIFGYEKDDPSDKYYRARILECSEGKTADGVERTLYTSKLQSAKTYFEKKLESLDDDQLEKLFTRLVTQFKFNEYEIDDDLDVFVTFESMNNRGKQLSKLELLKNRLIYLSTLLPRPDEVRECDWNNQLHQLRGDISRSWKTIYSYLGRDPRQALDDDQFLFHHWVVYFKFSKSEADPHVTFLLSEHFTLERAAAKENPLTLVDISDYSRHLAESAKYWYAMHFPNGDASLPKGTAYWLEKLTRLRWGPFKPLLLAAMLNLGMTGDKDALESLVREVERFVFMVFFLSGRRSNASQTHFFNRAHDVFANKIPIADVTKEIQEYNDGSDGWFDLTAFRKDIDELLRRRQGYYKWSGLKYLLFEYEIWLLEQKKRNDAAPQVRWNDFIRLDLSETVEHIYPETPNAPYWLSRFKFANRARDQQRQSIYMHSLGNLLLLSKKKNPSIGNDPFPTKRARYADGSHSEREVHQTWEHWTKSAIYQRGVRILMFAETRWGFSCEDWEVTYNSLLLPGESHLKGEN